AIGFIKMPSVDSNLLKDTPVALVGIFLTVAIPEEIFFRGALQAPLERSLGRNGALAFASAAFGLMHWNNATGFHTQIAYIALAAVAGVFYGIAYRRAGLFAAALCHTIVDLLWHLFLDAGT